MFRSKQFYLVNYVCYPKATKRIEGFLDKVLPKLIFFCQNIKAANRLKQDGFV